MTENINPGLLVDSDRVEVTKPIFKQGDQLLTQSLPEVTELSGSQSSLKWGNRFQLQRFMTDFSAVLDDTRATLGSLEDEVTDKYVNFLQHIGEVAEADREQSDQYTKTTTQVTSHTPSGTWVRRPV